MALPMPTTSMLAWVIWLEMSRKETGGDYNRVDHSGKVGNESRCPTQKSPPKPLSALKGSQRLL